MTTAQSKYDSARRVRTPPHVSIRNLRLVSSLTLDQLLDRMEDASGLRYSRGALSAVESGLRGASTELIAALELAYGLEPGSIDVDYKRRLSTSPAAGIGTGGAV